MEIYEASLKLLSIYRHEFLNCLQVIGGLVQLGKTERLMDFIRKSGEEIQQLGRLAGCGDPRLSLIIYDYLWSDPDFILSLQVRGKLFQLPEEALTALARWLDTFCSMVKNHGPCEITVSVKAEDRPCLSLQLNQLQHSVLGRLSSDKHSDLDTEIDFGENRLTLFLDKVRLPEER